MKAWIAKHPEIKPHQVKPTLDILIDRLYLYGTPLSVKSLEETYQSMDPQKALLAALGQS